MHPYAKQVAEWDVAVSVIADDCFQDIELLSVRPTPATDFEVAGRAPGIRQRGLSWRGVAGIMNGELQFLLDYAPSPCDVEGWTALKSAVALYCDSLRWDEVSELNWLWQLEDPRPA